MTAPGVYDGIPELQYHADKTSLSFSGAKRMLPPHCPAQYKHDLDNGGRPNKATFDIGHAVHSLVLGVGQPVSVVEADDWRGKSAREQRDVAYSEGLVPVLASNWLDVQAMAKVVHEHPIAAALLAPSSGKPEQSLYSVDKQTGVQLRCRFDWLREPDVNGVLVGVDYKTARSADPQTFARSAATYRYHQQAAWYSDMAIALGLATDVRFLFVVQEKTAPYLVSVVELDDEAVAIGRALNRQAIDLYDDCVKRDRWPGYSDDIELVSLPQWATYDQDLDVIA